MQNRTEEHDETRPPENEIELLVSVSWAEQEGDDGVLCRGEKNNRKLGKDEEA